MRNVFLFAAALFLLLTFSNPVNAQGVNPRIGFGVNSMLSTSDGLGIGFRGRASAPVNADVSIALDAGFTGFILGGRDDASYIFDPQASAIVNLPRTSTELSYLMFGLGAYVPMGETTSRSGPTIHFGYGRVRVLQETSLFYEFNPALIIAQDRVHLALPVRIGIIF